jgi:hypothetical protein
MNITDPVPGFSIFSTWPVTLTSTVSSEGEEAAELPLHMIWYHEACPTVKEHLSPFRQFLQLPCQTWHSPLHHPETSCLAEVSTAPSEMTVCKNLPDLLLRHSHLNRFDGRLNSLDGDATSSSSNQSPGFLIIRCLQIVDVH